MSCFLTGQGLEDRAPSRTSISLLKGAVGAVRAAIQTGEDAGKGNLSGKDGKLVFAIDDGPLNYKTRVSALLLKNTYSRAASADPAHLWSVAIYGPNEDHACV